MGDLLQNAPVVGMKKRFPRNFGRYILEKSLSRGGMGEVMLAVAKGPNQRCVIKTIRGDLTGDEEFIGRFADEAKIMVRISHENIIRVFDAGKVDHDYYIAMEYVHGRDLGDVLDRAYERGEPLPVQIGLYITTEVLRGLDYAHALTDEHGRHMGLVHRDISPQNVLVGFDGSIKIIDFGLARTDVLPSRTQGALAVGKYGYMSPEQARHEKIDGRADIYSTGVMLFEVFTGDRLVDEQDQATLWQRVLSPKHRLPRAVLASLPTYIDELVGRAVQVRPDDRFRDAAEMLRYADKYRGQETNRDAFVRYLKVLYPKVDFAAPPMPEFGGLVEGGNERSIIIATSREAQRSVFGRGELAIEGTSMFDLAQVAQIRDNIGRKKKAEGFSREVVTDTHPTEEGKMARDPAEGNERTHVRTVDQILPPSTTRSDGPTQVARYPEKDSDSTQEGRYRRRGDSDAGGPEATLQSAPVRGVTSNPPYRDEEKTIMMDAPPRNLRAQFMEDPGEGDTPTRLSKLPGDDAPKPVVVAAPGRGRDIKERVTRAPEEPKPAVGTKERKIAVHRATVPTEGNPGHPERTRHDPASVPPLEATQPEGTPRLPSYLVPGLVLLGAAILLAVVVFVAFSLN